MMVLASWIAAAEALRPAKNVDAPLSAVVVFWKMVELLMMSSAAPLTRLKAHAPVAKDACPASVRASLLLRVLLMIATSVSPDARTPPPWALALALKTRFKATSDRTNETLPPFSAAMP